MLERFTDSARRIILVAQEEARILRHAYLGTEHLMLALVQDASIAPALDPAVDVEMARATVAANIGVGPGASGHIPFTPRAKRVLEQAVREANSVGHAQVKPDHLFLALIGEGEGGGIEVLVQLGVDLGASRARLMKALERSAFEPEESSASASAAFGFGSRAEEPPNCTRCGASLSDTAAFKTLQVPEDGGSGSARVMFVYCEACGETIVGKVLEG